MRREVLRIHNLSVAYDAMHFLRNVDLNFLEGTCTGLMGLTRSGKDFLVNILTGQTPVRLEGTHLRVDFEVILRQEQLSEYVYHMTPKNYGIRQWTAGEYISLKQSGWLLTPKNRQRMREKIQGVLKRLALSINLGARMEGLTEMEKREMDLVKACVLGKRILVVEDELEGLTREEMEAFGVLLRKAAALEGLCVIVSAHSWLVTSILAEILVIFRNGTVSKKLHKAKVSGVSELEGYLLGRMGSSKKDLDTYVKEHRERAVADRKERFVIRGLPLRPGQAINLTFQGGAVTTLLVLGEGERKYLYDCLSGRALPELGDFRLGDQTLRGGDYHRFVQLRIVSVGHLGGREEIFPNLSLEENLLLPSLRKISARDYMFSSEQILKAMGRENKFPSQEGADIALMDANDRIRLILQRWYLYRPKVFILLEPFEQCDVYGAALVRSYIRQFAEQGAAVVVIKSREEHMEDISDEMIRLY